MILDQTPMIFVICEMAKRHYWVHGALAVRILK
jgi:hypothetical protein